jgi:hypothetical protein
MRCLDPPSALAPRDAPPRSARLRDMKIRKERNLLKNLARREICPGKFQRDDKQRPAYATAELRRLCCGWRSSDDAPGQFVRPAAARGGLRAAPVDQRPQRRGIRAATSAQQPQEKFVMRLKEPAACDCKITRLSDARHCGLRPKGRNMKLRRRAEAQPLALEKSGRGALEHKT